MWVGGWVGRGPKHPPPPPGSLSNGLPFTPKPPGGQPTPRPSTSGGFPPQKANKYAHPLPHARPNPQFWTHPWPRTAAGRTVERTGSKENLCCERGGVFKPIGVSGGPKKEERPAKGDRSRSPNNRWRCTKPVAHGHLPCASANHSNGPCRAKVPARPPVELGAGWEVGLSAASRPPAEEHFPSRLSHGACLFCLCPPPSLCSPALSISPRFASWTSPSPSVPACTSLPHAPAAACLAAPAPLSLLHLPL